MKRKNISRNALVTSIISLLLCVSMLVGTTFAWFTDEVVSGVNTIAAGNLDIELLANNEPVTENTKLFTVGENQLWEPGVVVYENLEIKNIGSLALKYQMTLAPYAENATTAGNKLSEVVKIAVIDEIAENATRADILAAAKASEKVGTLADFFVSGTLNADETTGVAGVVVFWEPNDNEVDNLYNLKNGLETTDGEPLFIEFSVKLFATQQMKEEDSFGPDYDKLAWANALQVRTPADLAAAIAAGEETIMVMADMELTEALVIPEGAKVAINLNGKKLTTEAAYDSAAANASSALVNNGTLTLVGGTIAATNNYTVRNYGTMVIDGTTINNGMMNFGDLTVNSGSISNSRSGKHAIYGNAAKLTINGGEFYNGNPGNATVFAYGGEVVLNGGEYTIADGTATLGWTSCLIDAQGGAKYEIYGGTYEGDIRDYNKNTQIYGGTFTKNPSSFVAAGYSVFNNNGAYIVASNTSSSTVTLDDGATLDLKGVEFAGTVKALGDLTIKGDTKIKTLSATNGGTITIENGKTLTLNNFSFGAKSTAGSKYTITGGTITASYGFFQHGTYDLYSDFETGYMYYSYGSDITVYGTFHSQGKGDGLDYVRGNLTIANGGKSIHDKSLWVGQPASWGAMNASLTVEEGGYVQANSLSVYEGSVAYNSAANVGKENAGVKYNTLSGEVTVR